MWDSCIMERRVGRFSGVEISEEKVRLSELLGGFSFTFTRAQFIYLYSKFLFKDDLILGSLILRLAV